MKHKLVTVILCAVWLAGLSVITQVGSGEAFAQESGWTDDGSVVRLTTETDAVGIGTNSPNAKLHVMTSDPGSVAQQIIENSDNTSGYSDAVLQMLAGGPNGGDPYIRFDVSGGRAYSMGIDNSWGQQFIISTSTSLGGTQDILRYLPISQEFQLWQSTDPEHAAPLLNLDNRKAGEVSIRFNRQMDDNLATEDWWPNPWVIHIPPSLTEMKFWITRDAIGNYFGLDEEGRASVGSTLPNNWSGISRLGVIGGRNEKQFIVKGNSTQTFSLAEWQNSAGIPLVKIGGDGKVGIGASNPAGALHTAWNGIFNSNTEAGLVLANMSSPTKRIDMGYDGGGPDAGYIQAKQAGLGNKPLMINPSGGNVGIGTAVPVSTLHVGADGTISLDPRSTNPAATGGVWKLYIYENGSTRQLRVIGPNGTVNVIKDLTP